MEAGHQIAKQRGYDFVLLLGHPTYYPRFGYKTNAYGASSVTVAVESLPEIKLKTANPVPEDISELAELHHLNERQVNCAIVPENSPAEWLSTNPAVPCTVYRYRGKIVGYTRGTADNLHQFLAKDDRMAGGIAKHLAGDVASIELPLHPDSLCANAFDEKPVVKAWEAGMIHPLRDDSIVHDYLNNIENGALVGRVIWSSCFDIV